MSEIYWIIGGCSAGGILLITYISIVIYKCCKKKKRKGRLNVEAGEDAWQAHGQNIDMEGEMGPLAKRHADGLCQDTLTRTKVSQRTSVTGPEFAWHQGENNEGKERPLHTELNTSQTEVDSSDGSHGQFDAMSGEASSSPEAGEPNGPHHIETFRPEASTVPDEIQEKYYSIKKWNTRRDSKRSKSFSDALDEGPAENRRSIKKTGSLPSMLARDEVRKTEEEKQNLREWRKSFKLPKPDYPGATVEDGAADSKEVLYKPDYQGTAGVDKEEKDDAIPQPDYPGAENPDSISIGFNESIRNGYADPVDSGVDSEGYDALSRHGDDLDEDSLHDSPLTSVEVFNFHDLKKETVQDSVYSASLKEKELPVSLEIPYSSSDTVKEQIVVLHRPNSSSKQKGLLVESITVQPSTTTLSSTQNIIFHNPNSPSCRQKEPHNEFFTNQPSHAKDVILHSPNSPSYKGKGLHIESINDRPSNTQGNFFMGQLRKSPNSTQDVLTHQKGIPEIHKPTDYRQKTSPVANEVSAKQVVVEVSRTTSSLQHVTKPTSMTKQANDEPIIGVSDGIKKFQDKGSFVPQPSFVVRSSSISQADVATTRNTRVVSENLVKKDTPAVKHPETNSEVKSIPKDSTLGRATSSASIVAQTLKSRDTLPIQRGDTKQRTPEFGRIKLRSVPKVDDFRANEQKQETRNFGSQQHFGGPSRNVNVGASPRFPPYSKENNKKLTDTTPTVTASAPPATATAPTTTVTAPPANVPAPPANVPAPPPIKGPLPVSRNQSQRLTEEERAKLDEEKRRTWKRDQVEDRLRGTLLVNNKSVNIHASGLALKSCMPELFTKIKQRGPEPAASE